MSFLVFLMNYIYKHKYKCFEDVNEYIFTYLYISYLPETQSYMAFYRKLHYMFCSYF